MKQITVYGLLSKIYNYNGNISMPKKIRFCEYDYYWDEDFKDYLREDEKKGYTFSFLDEHNDNLKDFLQDTVDILDDEIKKLNLDKDELLKNVIITAQDYVIEGKINEIIDVINEMKNGQN